MLRRLVIPLFVTVALLGANFRLYLKDGTHQLVREYKVVEDRVRYYSVERSEWEEIPLNLVDLKRTEDELKQRQAVLEEETKAVAAEEKVEREQKSEAARVPMDNGVYFVQGKELVRLKQAEPKVVTSKKRSVLKVMSPIPIVSGKATVELDGEHAPLSVTSAEPEFYIRLAFEERFGIIRLAPKKGNRVVEKWTIVPVTKEIVQEQDEVPILRRQVAGQLYRIWPKSPLVPGEYAVVELTEGKTNTQVWDFSFRPSAVP